ncbi:peptidase family M20/M25/M40 protein [Mollisia scopiformis]|uniref:Peptidase family M20/M25/M40 protein n=1 Tax=Mollisia scopiformis TaxID=149040 RepID=A0A194X976_MOLSC|nr:peptidase family M20/M25/M40 protein [Mollisia scopiformis]KUJ16720.1 peptidase family M20/M25/M40 protein [Mollisia scopiformis]
MFIRFWIAFYCVAILAADRILREQKSFLDTLGTNPGSIIEQFRPNLSDFEDAYRYIHQHPELSCKELQTATYIEGELEKIGLKTHNKVGGHGVVGILENGPGSIIMLRSELDALPIREQTGLPYASKESMEDIWGRAQPVMHACGHDMHMACLLAACKLLSNAKSSWSGTLIAIFQPNEEHTGGAQAMVDDGLYDLIPVPDVVFAQHSLAIKTGMVSIKAGPVLVSAETMSIRLFASVGFPANPQLTIDPVVVSARILVQLESLAARIAGDDYASVGVQEIHAGQPGEDFVAFVDIILDVKAYNPSVRQDLVVAIQDLVEFESKSAGIKIPPEITTKLRAPTTNNSKELVQTLLPAFTQFFGADMVLDRVPKHPCEDFSLLASSKGVPYVFWFLGRVDPVEWERSERMGNSLETVPIEHSPFNAPVVYLTLKTGTDALSLAALSFFQETELLGKQLAHLG